MLSSNLRLKELSVAMRARSLRLDGAGGASCLTPHARAKASKAEAAPRDRSTSKTSRRGTPTPKRVEGVGCTRGAGAHGRLLPAASESAGGSGILADYCWPRATGRLLMAAYGWLPTPGRMLLPGDCGDHNKAGNNRMAIVHKQECASRSAQAIARKQ